MNNQNLAHQWANKIKTSGKGSNMFYEGDTIYSYGHHFAIAKQYTSKKNGDLILFTARDYSVTTAKHKRQVLNAIPSLKLYVTVPQVLISITEKQKDHQFNMNWIINEVSKNLTKATAARTTGEHYIGNITTLGRDFDVYTQYFKPSMNKAQKQFKKSIENKTLIPAALVDKINISIKKQEARQEALSIKRQAQQELDLAAWLAGADIRAYFEKTCLRVKEGFVETSRGAKVSLQAGKMAYKALKAGTLTAGYDIEGYTVISVNGTLKIGCHVIPMEEIERIASQLV